MENVSDVNLVFHLLAEQVCKRLRSHGLKCSVIQIHLRSNDLNSFERQMHLAIPTDISGEVCAAAMELLKANYNFYAPLRSVGIRAAELSDAEKPVQLSFFKDTEKENKLREIEKVKDQINNRYGKYSICRAVLLSDKSLFPEYDPAGVTSSFRSH